MRLVLEHPAAEGTHRDGVFADRLRGGTLASDRQEPLRRLTGVAARFAVSSAGQLVPADLERHRLDADAEDRGEFGARELLLAFREVGERPPHLQFPHIAPDGIDVDVVWRREAARLDDAPDVVGELLDV